MYDVQIHFRFFQKVKSFEDLYIITLAGFEAKLSLYCTYLKKGDSGRILNCNFEPPPPPVAEFTDPVRELKPALKWGSRVCEFGYRCEILVFIS